MNLNQPDLINEKLPIKTLLPLGLQHVLAMYAGALAVPIIVGTAIGLTPQQIGYLVAADLFTCGIATLIQSLGFGKHIGVKLPVIMGCSFVSVAPMITIGKASGLPVIYGAVICAGIFVVLISFFFGKLLKFFPSLVTGTVIMIVGLSLIPVALNDAAGGYGPTHGNPKNLILAGIVVIFICILNRYFKGFMQATSVLLGLVFGTILASFMGMVDMSAVSSAGWFRVVTPFYFGLPKFELGPIFTMCLISLILMIEAVGVFIGVSNICGKKVENSEIVSGLRGEGIAQILGGVFNSFPYTTFSQNVGLVALSGIKSRYVTVCSGIILICLGIIPKIAALATIIPHAVLGGATLAMFGMVAVSGIRILSTVDLTKTGNMLTIALAVGIGISSKVSPGLFDQLPYALKFVLEDGIVAGSIVAIFGNIFFNYKEIMVSENNAPIPNNHTL
ncbi:nucleobase:cation symporter-2 family protein [Clostridium sp. CF012]|uniref:nucleobase:cation symporter-2 family protein n=1 Tax=Clostridium sp. CF012 TaxID=2843319 RepID=UPI001C0D7CF2|nr:nucleobase:cation symporter-2 family protein [Clostridium sp. CF012]MBU3144009.1 purine permease [Clostridium sp. CF012]